MQSPYLLLLKAIVAAFLMAQLLASSVAAQYSENIQKLRSASEQYDERGFTNSKSITVDGKLIVSNSSGSISYSYPISKSYTNGHPIEMTLNYCNSVAFTSFLEHRWADHGTSFNRWEYMTEPTEYRGWAKFHQNRPAWILGVNGFAVQVLATSTQFHAQPGSQLFNTGVYDYNDYHFIWAIDGYDFCNRMEDFGAVARRTETFVDIIRLLRADGSVLELRNMNENFDTNVDCDTISRLYTGYYHINQANERGFAKVEYDSSYWTYPMRQIDIEHSQYRGSIQPRKVRYFPGDGLEYIFREWCMPYGANAYADSSNRFGGVWAGPTIFYLEEIRGSDGGAAAITRTRHYPETLDFWSTKSLDTTAGRALFWLLDDHTVTYGLNSMTIEALGRTTKVFFNKVMGSGNALEGYYSSPEVTWMPLAQNGMASGTARELANISPTNPYLYKSWLGYVTRIIDPEGRQTNFTYESYTTKYRNFGFPRATVGTGDITISLVNQRLKRIEEPGARYRIDYYGRLGGVYDPDDERLLTPNTFQDPYTLNNIVKEVRKYGPDWSPLTREAMSYGFHFADEKPYVDFCTVTTSDYLSGSSKSTTYEYFVDPLPIEHFGDPQPRYTELRKITESTDDCVTQTTMVYGLRPFIPPVPQNITWNTRFFIPEIKRTVAINNVVKSWQAFDYVVGTARTFGGDTTVARNYGQEVFKKITRTYNGNNVLLLKDTVEYLHLPQLDTAFTRLDTLLRKFDTIKRYLEYNDSAMAEGDTCLKWEVAMYMPGICQFRLDTFAGLASIPPMYGIEQRHVTLDPSGNYLQGKVNVIDTHFVPDPLAPVPHRGGILVDSIIGRGGERRVLLNHYRYDRMYGATFPSYKGNANGSGIDLYYSCPLIYNSASGWYEEPYGNLLHNNDRVTREHLHAGVMFAGNYGLPELEQQSVRRYDTSGNLRSDILSRYYRRTFYGLPTATLDPNGWMSAYDYDRNGRLLKAVLPYDFHGIDTTNTKEFESSESFESIGSTTYISDFDTVWCDINSGAHIQHPARVLNVEPGILYADYPYWHAPNCSTGVVTEQKHGPSIARNVTAPISFVWKEPSTGIIGFHTLPNGVSDVIRVDSAYLDFYVSQIIGDDVVLTIQIPLLNFTLPIVFNSTGITPDTLQAHDGPLRIDLTSVKEQILGLDSFTVEFRVATVGARVELISGAQGEDTRPRLFLKGRFKKVTTFGDYTLAYEYDDSALTNRTMAKVDDYRHTESSWDTAELGGMRYSAVRNFFGADYRLNRSEIAIGSPNVPQRVDTVFNTFTGSGLKTRVQDQQRDTVVTQYDGLGRPVKVINGDGTSSTITYPAGTLADCGITDDEDNFVTGFCSAKISTNENGVVFAQYFDGFDRLCREVADTNGMKLVTKYFYDLLGHLTKVINPKGDTTHYWYDEFGRIKYKQQPDLGTISYAYDNVGNVRFTQSQQQSQEHKLTFTEYDDLNRPTVIGEAKLSTEGLPSAPMIEGEPYLNRLTDRIDATVLQDDGTSGIVTANRTLWMPPVRAVPVFWTMTSLDSAFCPLQPDTLLGETDPPIGPYLKHPAFFYQPSLVGGSGANDFEHLAQYPEFPRIGISYDRLPERKGAIWGAFPSHAQWDSLSPKGTVRNLKGHEAAVAYREHDGEPYHFVVMSYDERGRLEALLRSTENLGFDAVYYTYNSRNQVTSVRVADPIRQHTTWYGYNWNGQIDTVWTELSAPWNGLGVMTPRYPAPQAKPSAADIVYTYTKTGQVSRKKYPPVQVSVDYAYNHRKWLRSMLATQLTAPPFQMPILLFQQILSYDPTGQIISQQWQHRGSAIQRQYYSYDSVQRLTAWGNGGADTARYSYDAVGNRQTVSGMSGGMPADILYQYLGAGPNQLTQAMEVGGANPITKRYSYNHDGAVTGITRHPLLALPPLWEDSVQESYIYSWRGLLRQYNSLQYLRAIPADTVGTLYDWRYRYSAAGEREQKRLYLARDGGHQILSDRPWVYYLLGADKAQLAVYHAQELDMPGCGKPGSGALFYPEEYLSYGVGTAANVIMKPLGGLWTKEYRVEDHLGSVRMAITPNTAISGYDYEPFGKLLASWTSSPTRKSFIDKEKDRENGLGDFGVRKYEEESGRFLSVDPLWEKYREWTPYNYSANNPILECDPSGLNPGGGLNVIVNREFHDDIASGSIGGALAGTIVNGAVEAARESIESGELNPDKIVAATVQGFISGAITGGFGAAANAINLSRSILTGSTVGVSTLAEVAGGIVGRTVSGQNPLDKGQISGDAANGVVGGMVGAKFSSSRLGKSLGSAADKIETRIVRNAKIPTSTSMKAAGLVVTIRDITGAAASGLTTTAGSMMTSGPTTPPRVLTNYERKDTVITR